MELFPAIVAAHDTYSTTGIIKPDQIFNIATMAHPRLQCDGPVPVAFVEHQAILTYGNLGSRRVAVWSDCAGTMIGALESLLQVTAGVLSEAQAVLLDQTPMNTVDVYGGGANADLLPEGLREMATLRKDSAAENGEGMSKQD